MAQIDWGRAGLVRLPVIPSPSCGHGVVRWQHAGSIKRGARRWFGGHDKRRPCAVAQPVVRPAVSSLAVACRGEHGRCSATASFDALFVGRDLGRRRVALHRLDRRPSTALEPCLVMCPRCTTVSDSRWRMTEVIFERSAGGGKEQLEPPRAVRHTSSASISAPPRFGAAPSCVGARSMRLLHEAEHILMFIPTSRAEIDFVQIARGARLRAYPSRRGQRDTIARRFR